MMTARSFTRWPAYCWPIQGRRITVVTPDSRHFFSIWQACSSCLPPDGSGIIFRDQCGSTPNENTYVIGSGRMTMVPDIVVSDVESGKWLWVLDTKHTAAGSPSNVDVCQGAAYRRERCGTRG
jgi:hypothetical protein